MTKRTKRISKALDSALVSACERYGPQRIDGAEAFISACGGITSDELRSMFDLWWRFGLGTGEHFGNSMIFDRSFDFDQVN